ncbi:hypothetical protein BKA70DRAFT_1428142 [Coprinopsis sp. MPI-PUGE-AT-0042]|nr:hypothetical protein BKA70DRAFT_1428142 [Coprinopsis sp. MPI-PUGE-AT-0042]
MNLPVELLRLVISILHSEVDTLARIRLACHAANCIAEPMFFSTIRFKSRGGSSNDSAFNFYRIITERPAIEGFMKRLQVSSSTALGSPYLQRIFHLMKKKKAPLDAIFESERRFEPLDGIFIHRVVIHVAPQLTSLRLSNVHLTDHSFILLFPKVKDLSILGVKGLLFDPLASVDPNTTRPSPLFLRYAEKITSIRQMYDEGEGCFKPHNRMRPPTKNAFRTHPDPTISLCDWSKLESLFFETGFLRDILVMAHVVPAASHSLENLFIDVTGLQRHWSTPDTFASLLPTLPALRSLTIRVRTCTSTEKNEEDPLLAIVTIVNRLQAPSIRSLLISCWFQHLTREYFLGIGWSSLNSAVDKLKTSAHHVTPTFSFVETTAVGYSYTDEEPLPNTLLEIPHPTLLHGDADHLPLKTAPEGFINRFLPSFLPS